MHIIRLTEHGLEQALVGLSLSYNCPPGHDMMRVANKLANKDGGHNVFLEQIVCWLDIDAPRYWWQQMDRYRTGTTRQSQSTMHTLTKRLLHEKDFAAGTAAEVIALVNQCIASGDFDGAKKNLPESFLQRRIMTINYKSLRNIIWQRHNHRLKEWQAFCDHVLEQVDHPEWLTNEN